MDDLDRKIEEALNEEDRALLDQFSEQGPFGQWFGVYDGKMRWFAVFATVLTFVMTFGAFYCGWKLLTVTSVSEMARWGAGAVILMVMVGFLKLWFWMRMESNRILREVKRLELQIARQKR